MANYKNIKLASLTLSCFCFSLNVFGMENGVLAHAALEEKGDRQPKRVCVLPPSSAAPTLLDAQERLMIKVQVLKNELPKAQPTF